MRNDHNVLSPMDPNVIPAPEAARRKDCSRQTIYNALDRDDLTEVSFEKSRLVVMDDKWDEWAPAMRGRRVQKREAA